MPSAASRCAAGSLAARERAQERAGKPNADLAGGDIDRFCRPDGAGMALLEAAMERLGLSARAYHRILKLARTIADLDHAEAVGERHIAEAVGYRQLDRRSRF